MVTEKLMKVQQELKCSKNQYNAYGGFKYRSCEDILEAVKPLLKKQGLLLTLSDEIVNLGDRFYVKATATIRDGEEVIQTQAFAREDANKKGMDSSQQTGSCSSYARKYALNGMFCIDDVKDADTMDNTEKASAKQISYLASLYKGENLQKLLKANGIKSLEEMPKTKASEIISKIKEG